MKCPLFVIGVIASEKPERIKLADCLKEECAWWDAEIGRCFVITLKPVLSSIAFSLIDILAKMPSPEFFKK